MGSDVLDLSVYPDEYATDDVSATSTAESEANDDYDVDAILSERLETDTSGRDETRYLIKWLGYEPHRCTWEPVESLIDESLLQAWERKKTSMTPAAFEEYCMKNAQALEDAIILANECQNKRHQKRVKKRMRLKQTREARSRPTISESDDDIPLVRRSKTRGSEALPTNATRARDQKFSRAPRKQPVEQSASGLEDDPIVLDLDDSTMEDLDNGSRREQERSNTDQGKPQNPSTARSSPTSNERKSSRESQTKASVQQTEPPGETIIDAPMTIHQKSNPATTALPNNNPKEQNAVASAGSDSAVNKSVTAAKGSDAIKIVNQPKTQTRKAWNTTGKHFSTLHFRALAEKRSRIEGTPDPGALEFVNGVPEGIPPKPTESRPRPSIDESPYGRRESGHKRLQELDSDNVPHSDEEGSPLRSFEHHKIPQTCFEWLNRSCPYTPERCRFLHRRTDPSGKPYSLSPWDGTVLPKYAERPLTCLYWLRGDTGCRNTADECSFAHENTGLLGQTEGPPETIDRDERPKSSSKHSKRPATCFYWFMTPAGCTKADQVCKFAHRNTGLLASRDGHSFEEIDPSLEPLSMRNTSSLKSHPGRNASGPKARLDGQTARIKSPATGGLTCFFWNQYKCFKSAEQCAYLHRYTGRVAEPPKSLGPQRPVPLRGSAEAISPIENPLVKRITADSVPNYEIGDETAQTRNKSDRLSRPQPDGSGPPMLSCLDLKHEIEKTLKLDFSKMFVYNNDQFSDTTLERCAFLLFHPEEHMEELELITRWLLLHHVKLYSFRSDGAWDHFKRQITVGRTGTIIAHPNFEHWADIPDFGEVLKGKVRVWSVGLQEELEFDPQVSTFEPEMRYDCIEIFPHGGIIYITDDVFLKEPQKALGIFELFFEKIKQCRRVAGPIDPWKRVDDGCLLWRIAVRPELMQDLYDKSVKHEAEIEARDPFHVSLWRLYELFAATKYIDQDDSEPFAHRPVDYYPVMSERFSIMEDYYYTAQRQSQVLANTKMVEYYAGVLVDQRQYYRQYFVVHTEPDGNEAKDWKGRIHNIDDVISPEKFIKEFKKEAKGNRFEFYEWAFPLKQEVGSISN